MNYKIGDKVYFNAYIPKNNNVYVGCEGYILAIYSSTKYKVIISEVWPTTVASEYRDKTLSTLIGRRLVRSIDGIEKKKAIWWGEEVIAEKEQKVIQVVNQSKKVNQSNTRTGIRKLKDYAKR